ncbi:hypothetical protein PQC38_gp032 [Aeromonas phage BUCT695]|uniref:hypothetical protein n=1 Tax=Aeromonas phage BUCT695 TaxID=2908630 RepID=UPI0023297153|nr:hypothetical protein PQC38_gp032 [Aeromonas phage BUCT695]UIW10508.1 hypothetical protein [Aeromonas phage BUCT695]
MPVKVNIDKILDEIKDLDKVIESYERIIADKMEGLEANKSQRQELVDKLNVQLNGINEQILKVPKYMHDLQEGDIIRCVGTTWNISVRNMVMEVHSVDKSKINLLTGLSSPQSGVGFEFICRPQKKGKKK